LLSSFFVIVLLLLSLVSLLLLSSSSFFVVVVFFVGVVFFIFVLSRRFIGQQQQLQQLVAQQWHVQGSKIIWQQRCGSDDTSSSLDSAAVAEVGSLYNIRYWILAIYAAWQQKFSVSARAKDSISGNRGVSSDSCF
jgi:hypothetical protein